MVTKRNLLKAVLGTAYPGLSDRGWFLLTRNWVVFFFAMAVLNEAVWRYDQLRHSGPRSSSGCSCPSTFLFAVANFPMLMRHGLDAGAKPTEEPPIPPSQ